MTCTKEDLVSAINSFGAAKATNDINLITFAGNLLAELLETIEFGEAVPQGETPIVTTDVIE